MTNNPVRRRFRLSAWPVVDDTIKTMPFSKLRLSEGLKKSIAKAFSGNERDLPSTVGEFLEIPPDMLIIKARPRPIGEGSVKDLLAALAVHGIVPLYPPK